MRILVVGANGQLGARCCGKLLSSGHSVRAVVRRSQRGERVASMGAEVVLGDLRAPDGLREHLAGVDAVVITANPVVPRAGDDPAAVEAGLTRLVDGAASSGVRRVVLVSLPDPGASNPPPMVVARRRLEQHVLARVPESVIPRFPPFMEVWIALVGSSVPLRGEEFATLGRPSPFLRLFRKGTATLVEDRGLMLVPGSPEIRNAFIAIDDVTEVCVRAVEDPALGGRIVDVAGPEVLTWRDVAATYRQVLGRPVRILSTPAPVYAAGAAALRPFATVASNTMALNHLIATTETNWSNAGGGILDPREMTTVDEFLTAKAALPAELPTVR
jgi:uncharacterized protein YbjT (DUF2867 family)